MWLSTYSQWGSHASIITGNTIKATFDKDALAEIHASSNNIDKLQSLVAKIYIAFNTKNLIYIIMCVVLKLSNDDYWAKYYCQPYVPMS
ncbi:unnamed protein product [Rhizophagus irregularis]|nr:unnamed protein product [Rhizophagus irregularis]